MSDHTTDEACKASRDDPLTDAMLDDIGHGRIGCRCMLLAAEVRRMRALLALLQPSAP